MKMDTLKELICGDQMPVIAGLLTNAYYSYLILTKPSKLTPQDIEKIEHEILKTFQSFTARLKNAYDVKDGPDF